MNNEKPRPRGFAAMDKHKRSLIAGRGGRAAHKRGTGYEWTSETAKEAGRKGGLARGKKYK